VRGDPAGLAGTGGRRNGFAASRRPTTEQELGCFFVAETNLLANATPGQRACIREQYLAYELDAAPADVLSRK
jgi:hypothetical protein